MAPSQPPKERRSPPTSSQPAASAAQPVTASSSDWGNDAPKSGIRGEVKLALMLVTTLASAFGYIVYRKFDAIQRVAVAAELENFSKIGEKKSASEEIHLDGGPMQEDEPLFTEPDTGSDAVPWSQESAVRPAADSVARTTNSDSPFTASSAPAQFEPEAFDPGASTNEEPQPFLVSEARLVSAMESNTRTDTKAESSDSSDDSNSSRPSNDIPADLFTSPKDRPEPAPVTAATEPSDNDSRSPAPFQFPQESGADTAAPDQESPAPTLPSFLPVQEESFSPATAGTAMTARDEPAPLFGEPAPSKSEPAPAEPFAPVPFHSESPTATPTATPAATPAAEPFIPDEPAATPPLPPSMSPSMSPSTPVIAERPSTHSVEPTFAPETVTPSSEPASVALPSEPAMQQPVTTNVEPSPFADNPIATSSPPAEEFVPSMSASPFPGPSTAEPQRQPQAAPTFSPADEPAPANEPEPTFASRSFGSTEQLYTIRPGDNYWSISRNMYGTSRYFNALSEYNRERIPDPSRMQPGSQLAVPPRELLEQRYPDLCGHTTTPAATPSATPAVANERGQFFVGPDGQPQYRVGTGDTLTGIAQKHLGRGSRWSTIFEMNRDVLPTADTLKPGTILRLPADASQVAVTP